MYKSFLLVPEIFVTLIFNQCIAGNKQVGEVCGLCTDPDKNYFCGHCEPGLECFDSTPNEKDNPMICRKIRGISVLIRHLSILKR